MRAGPTEGYAQHVLGRTGEATADRLAELGAPYQPGDVVGVTGLEARYERSLAGTPTSEIQVLDADDKAVRTLDTIEGRAPVAVDTTIDRNVQTAVEQALVGVTKPAAIVVTDPKGNIRAVASRPLSEDLNRALGGAYPPGSTFKVVTADALLADGTTPDTPVQCDATTNAGGRSFRNFEGGELGRIPFSQAFAESCNTAMITSTAPVDQSVLTAAAERFGFNAEYSVGLNTEGGSYPEPADATEKAAASIGQGRVTASPLHMATVAAAVTDGSWEPPTLLVDPPEEPEATGEAGAGAGEGDTATTAAGPARRPPATRPRPPPRGRGDRDDGGRGRRGDDRHHGGRGRRGHGQADLDPRGRAGHARRADAPGRHRRQRHQGRHARPVGGRQDRHRRVRRGRPAAHPRLVHRLRRQPGRGGVRRGRRAWAAATRPPSPAASSPPSPELRRLPGGQVARQ